MKIKGGYNILLKGRPDGTIKSLLAPSEYFLPLKSRRFVFSNINVKDGQTVEPGDILATDPENFDVPLLAPANGSVNTTELEGHIVLKHLTEAKDVSPTKREHPHIASEAGASESKRSKLMSLGAWQYFYDAFSDKLPDPTGTPQAIIVSILSLEPFLPRGDVQLKNSLFQFTRGLEHLQSLLEYQPIYLVVPDIRSEFAMLVHEHIRGYAWTKLVEVPLVYPNDNFTVIARKLGLKNNESPVWALRTEGILAVDGALTLNKPCLQKTITISGIGVNSPTHLTTVAGYPIKSIIDKYISSPSARIINGGLLTGTTIDDSTKGLDAECSGLTVIPELEEREFLGFVRPGWDRRSYSGCFLSSLRKSFKERLTTAVRGEDRPCVSCNYCEEVCPAGIMPHLIHKSLYKGTFEDAAEVRVDLCVECGLCSYVCPSKIELTNQFVESKQLMEKEKQDILREQQLKEEQELKEAQENSVEEKDL
jgi:Na(+)-translocating NADH:ubiquinone oxidoreductase A subunit